MANSLLDEIAGPAPQPAQASPTQSAQGGSLLEQVAAEQPSASPVTAKDTGTTSYLDEVQKHVTNTGKALWHGITGTPETEEETGAPTGSAPKQLGFTNENVAYKGGATARGVAGFFGGLAKDVLTMKPLPKKGTNLEENSPELAKSLVGKYIAAPSIEERQKAEDELKQYYNSPDAATAISHGLSAMIHKGAEWVPMVGPFAAGLVESAQKGDIGGTLAQLGALEAFDASTEGVKGKIKNKVGLAMLSPEDRGILKAEADKRAAAAKQAEAGRAAVDATNATVKGAQPKTPNTVAGERTTLKPTTQTTAGVTAPISALQQENPSVITKGAANLLTTPGAADEFQKTRTAPAATRQLASVIGQTAEDKINRHEAIMNGTGEPDQIAGTQTPSKFQTHDEAAKASYDTAQKTYKKADVASDQDVAAWQQTVKDALNQHKELLDRHNANIDAYNDNLAEGEEKMPHAVYDPNAVSIPEKPQSYSELKAELDRAKAEGDSSDAAIREDAHKTGIPKAEKAIDNWFKQHSDIISPAEYSSAKSLMADSYRYQEIANGLRSATNTGTITGNKLRSLEASIDNKQIRRGQAPGAFQRLLGPDGYENWQTVAKLFDPIKGAPKGIKAWGMYALEVAAAHMVPFGMAGTVATKFLMDRVMFNPSWGQWFSKLATNLKDAVTREHGELGAPGTVGDKFGEGGASKEFQELMDHSQGKAADGVKAQSAAQAPTTSLLDQVAPKDDIDARLAAINKEQAKTAVADTAHAQQARQELGASATDSDVMKRAQELKDAQSQPVAPEASTTHVTPVDPADRAVVNAGRPSPEQIAELDKSGIATRIPKTKNADVTNNPSHSRGLEAIEDADKLNPTTTKANGDVVLGHKATVADKLADYPNSGVPLTAKERANPGTVINKYLDHFVGNLTDLYKSVPPAIKNAAVKWYETAHYSAKDMADRYGVTQPQATAVIASLSPQNFWDNNVGLADRFIKHWTEAKNHMWDPRMDEATDRIREVQTKKIAKDEAKGKVASKVFLNILDGIRGKSYSELTKFAEDQGMDTNGLRRLQSQWLRMYDEAHGSSRTPLYSPDGSLRGTTARGHVPYDIEAKTLEILEGHDPAKSDAENLQHIHEVMGDGQKIRNFYNNIMNPWSKEGHVTIDTHAVGAAWGKPVSSADKTVIDNFRGAPGNGELGLSGMYSVYEEAYRRAAKEMGVSPRELQSVTWEGIRSLIEEQDKKSPEFRKDIDNIWKKVEDKKLSRADGMKQVMERAGGYKKPDWARPEDWGPKQPPVTPKANSTMHQMVSLGEGPYSITADVNPPALSPEVMKWKGQPQPRLTRENLKDGADWFNANDLDSDRLISAIHEAAHYGLLEHIGLSTEGTSMNLGNTPMKNGQGVSGGYIQTGPALNERYHNAQRGQESMVNFLSDFSSQLMAGRAVEEMLGVPHEKVMTHAEGDIRQVKTLLRQQGVPSSVMDSFIEKATAHAKELLKEKWDAVRHLATQAVNHYGSGEINGKTLQHYYKGGTYQK